MLRDGTRLFGTDGVRGKANSELTVDLAMGLARAAGEGRHGPMVIGRDTRRSGPMLSDALHAGFHSVGVDTIDVGIVPAGALSYLTRSAGATLGVMVSASHNPAEDNGIKFFGTDGAKLSDLQEDAIEARLRKGSPWDNPSGDKIGFEQSMPEALDTYVTHLAKRMPYSLQGMDLVLDCANGSAFQAAPRLLRSLKAGVEVFAAEPNGVNINDECGAVHPEFLARQANGRLGVSFDGDADRVIAIDEDGVPANGDVIIAILAAYLKRNDKLKGNMVVTTVMANIGFHRAMTDLDIELVETAVGDRYVLEAMRARRAVLGGEQSGHVILEDRTTGDGLATTLRLLEVMAATGQSLAELRTIMTEFPQVLRNVRVDRKEALADAESLWAAVGDVEAKLAGEGRVLVRASGTEPVVRVMVEATTRPEAASHADQLAGVIRLELSR